MAEGRLLFSLLFIGPHIHCKCQHECQLCLPATAVNSCALLTKKYASSISFNKNPIRGGRGWGLGGVIRPQLQRQCGVHTFVRPPLTSGFTCASSSSSPSEGFSPSAVLVSSVRGCSCSQTISASGKDSETGSTNFTDNIIVINVVVMMDRCSDDGIGAVLKMIRYTNMS